jgi:hypothetical protein
MLDLPKAEGTGVPMSPLKPPLREPSARTSMDFDLKRGSYLLSSFVKSLLVKAYFYPPYMFPPFVNF